jgi:hypothetical protein
LYFFFWKTTITIIINNIVPTTAATIRPTILFCSLRSFDSFILLSTSLDISSSALVWIVGWVAFDFDFFVGKVVGDNDLTDDGVEGKIFDGGIGSLLSDFDEGVGENTCVKAGDSAEDGWSGDDFVGVGDGDGDGDRNANLDGEGSEFTIGL